MQTEERRGVVRRSRAGLLHADHGHDHEGAADQQRCNRDRRRGEPQAGQDDPGGHEEMADGPDAQPVGVTEAAAPLRRWTARLRCRRRARRGRTSAGRPPPRGREREGTWPAGCSRSRARRSRSRGPCAGTTVRRRSASNRERPRSPTACATKQLGTTIESAATAPSSSQSWLAGTPGRAAARQNSPANAIPRPTPAYTMPGEIGASRPRQLLQRPRAGRDERPGAEHAGDAAQDDPRCQSIERAHGGRGHGGADKAHAHQRRQGEAQPARGQGAGQIARVVAGRQPGAGALRQRAVTHHQRQERREGEPADSHRHRQRHGRNGAGSRDG